MNMNVKMKTQNSSDTPNNANSPRSLGEEVAEIQALSHEGRGIAKIAGKTVFIDGALPGETVKFSYQKRKRRYDEGKVIEIIQASQDRVVAPCPHFSLCGGCSLQHLDPNAQLLFKQNMVLEQLRHFGGVSPERILPPLLGPTTGYRRRARLGVKYVIKKEKMLIGFREKRNSLLADLEGCEVLHPSVGKIFDKLKKLVSALRASMSIPQIEVAIGDTVCALIFRHLEDLHEKDKALLIAFGIEHQIDIYLQPAGPESVHRIWPALTVERPLSYQLPEFGVEIRFQPGDFTQVNAAMNQQMVAKVVDYLHLQPSDSVLDLFCGLGNFTLPLAKHAHKVVGVEGGALAVKRAKENALWNNIQNVEFYQANLQESVLQAPWTSQTYDKILLDPPRTGAIEMIPLLASFKASRIVYVSCNPATLARDIGELVKQGYTLESIGLLDMFPHTTHVESIAVLQRSLASPTTSRSVGS